MGAEKQGGQMMQMSYWRFVAMCFFLCRQVALAPLWRIEQPLSAAHEPRAVIACIAHG